MTQLQLDVVVPTHNRAPLLVRMLESLLSAERPERLDVSVIVVDNRSTDDTRSTVESFVPKFAGRLHYVYESRAGRSHALNAGIAVSRADLIGMIDDDEEVDSEWFRVIADAFEDQTTDFIGGPYVPRWGAARPVWLGDGYGAVIGSTTRGNSIQPFGPSCEAMLMGGNAIIRRSVLQRAGPYAVDLGRTPGRRLMSCEDEDMFVRLLGLGAHGFYRPDLIIHHYVPAERLTKKYFRRWCFWHGVSQGVLDRRRPAAVSYVLGVPRYMIGVAIRSTIGVMRPPSGLRQPARIFKTELAWWDLFGFVYGKHLYRPSRTQPESPVEVTREAGERGTFAAMAVATPPPEFAAGERPAGAVSSSRSAAPGR